MSKFTAIHEKFIYCQLFLFQQTNSGSNDPYQHNNSLVMRLMSLSPRKLNLLLKRLTKYVRIVHQSDAPTKQKKCL